MDLDELTTHYRAELTSFFSGRRILLIGAPVAGLVALARQLQSLGAEPPLLIGSGVGTGELPEQSELPWCSVSGRAHSAVESMRVYEAQLAHPPQELRARIDAYDPERRALALGAIVLSELPSVAGRPRLGARPKSWLALEDKVQIDAFWDAAGVARAPSRVVPVDASQLANAHADLDEGQGTMWAADARDGVHGGAEGLRWVRSSEDRDAALEFMSTRAERVRVMPFLEGIPCSIHCIVTREEEAVFRPVELVTLRREQRLIYAGAASYWDPPENVRAQMRDAARLSAELLRQRTGYRGAFTIDGICSGRRFFPTELNPRIGAGMFVLGAAAPELPLLLVALAAQAGEALDFRLPLLESALVAACEERRRGGSWVPSSTLFDRNEKRSLSWRGDDYVLCPEQDGEADATLEIGPSEIGCFVRLTPNPDRTPRGPSFAPRAARGLMLADREYGLGLGQLETALAR